MDEKRTFEISAAGLHLLAMVLMLGDHLWATVVPGNQWLTCLGRLSFPIFAFLIVEGYFHTSDLRRYKLRLLFFALLSEIPFNLMYSSGLFYPFHQNVLWTLLTGLLLIHFNEFLRKKQNLFLTIAGAFLSLLLGFLAGQLMMSDYGGAGVLTVLVFYFLRKRKLWCLLGQIAALHYINTRLIGGLYYELSLFGLQFQLFQQSFALLALLPIWLYRGRQGHHSRGFRAFCYAFYPLHMLILGLILRLR